MRLADYRGRVVVLQFWARWCASCEDDLKIFQSIHQTQGAEVAVLGLGVGSGSRSEIAGFADSLGIDFPMLLCREDTKNAYEVAVFPTTILVGREGHIRLRRTGALIGEYWEKVIAEELARGQ